MNLASFLSRRSAGAGALACAVALAAGAWSSAAASARTAVAACTTSGLVVWLDTRGNATAGSFYYDLKFTNLSGHACTLRGFPGISAVDIRGHQLGSPGSRATSSARLVSLADGGTATALLRITVAANFPNATCRRVTAAGLRVYPPNQRVSKVVPFPFEACSRSGPVYVSVRAVVSS
ncbi:MAG TPA: DUF4232 domain-containing protein [Gaiellaceae bacterium]